MSDDLRKRRPQDASKISLTEPWEVEYWTVALGVSSAELRRLVQQYGHSAATIRSKIR
ncbi:MAG: DUF3606 domain-containing protein [Geobacter sp.]|nr:MAG: DUF3606 domain-containing protein [Geobacter sp.]